MTASSDSSKAASHQFAVNPDLATALDFVRALSAQLVLLGHALFIFEVFPALKYPHVPALQRVGVVVFFILSGLLISHSAMLKAEREKYGFKIFFIDRFSRIYAGFAPGLVFILVLDLINMHLISPPGGFHFTKLVGFKEFFGDLFMLQGHPILGWLAEAFHNPAIQIDHLGSGGTLWTLPIEWWFYMFFGWVFLAGGFFRRNPIPYLIIIAFLAVVPVYYLFEGKGNGVFSYIWFTGVIMTLVLNRIPPKALPSLSAALVSAVFFAMLLYYLKYYASNRIYDLKSATFLAGGLFFFFCIFRHTHFIPRRASRVIRLFADSSYTLYLIHYTVCAFLAVFRGNLTDTWLFVLAMLASNLAALALAFAGEMRHKKFNHAIKRRLGIHIPPVSTRPG